MYSHHNQNSSLPPLPPHHQSHLTTIINHPKEAIITSSSPSSSSQHLSDEILLFEKIFLEIYRQYHHDLCLISSNTTIDLSQNMLQLCLDHLISFCCWARSDSTKLEWLHKLLLENSDLRPEVRNGIALIIIYVFASAKEHLESENMDMFGVLQDPHYGLGIVHKTSLRIYNDPLNYFGFIKCCITGLIFAHAIPENERHNKPKSKVRQTEQIVMEVNSYFRMKDLINASLQENQHHQAQEYIRQLLLFWQTNKHKVRETWFSAALASITYPIPPQLNAHVTGSIPSQGHQPQSYATSPLSYPTFQQFPSQTKQDESLDNFWNGDSSLEIGFGLDDPYGMEVNNSQPPKLHTSANSSNLASLISGNEPNYFDGISSFHSSSNTPATAPSSHRSSPVSSVGGRTKLSRDNSYDTLEIGHSHGILLNREKYRDHHLHSDYPSDGDQPHHNLTHGIEIDHDGRGIESHPSKFPRLSERGQYDSTVDDTESSHDCGNSDSGSVVGNYSHVVPQPGQPLGRSISDCSLLSEIHISPTSQSVPIHHSFSCNSLPGPTMKSSSLTQIMAHTPHHGHPSPHSSIHLNSFHIGGHSGHSHSSLLHHRALVNSHESKLHRHHSGDHSHHTQSQSRQPTNQHMSPASISSTHTSPRPLVAFHQPLQILRFTKVSSQSWTMHIDKVYQIELFLNKLPKCVVYLLDDKSFPQQEWNDHKLDTLNQDPLSSCNNLQKELELRKVLVTSWPPSLHDQLVGFVNNWNALLLQHEEQKSLHEERLSPPLPLLHEPPSLLGLWRNGPISLPHSSSSSPGILAYEISLQLGVIIRADPFTEENTMWNLLYLQDILHTTPEVHISTWSCYDFFCHLFPHFHHFLINLTHEHGGVDLTRLAIKYCSHPMTSSSSSNGENQRDPMMMCLPPSHSLLSAYQTIGVLNEPAIKIISRLQGEDPLFHDILIFPTY